MPTTPTAGGASIETHTNTVQTQLVLHYGTIAYTLAVTAVRCRLFSLARASSPSFGILSVIEFASKDFFKCLFIIIFVIKERNFYANLCLLI